MSNTINANLNRPINNLLTKAPKSPTKDEYAKMAATKTRDAEEATKPATDGQVSLIAKDPAAPTDVKTGPKLEVGPPVKIDNGANGDVNTTIIDGVKPEPRPMGPAVQPQNNDILAWLQNNGVSSISMEKKSFSATITPTMNTTPSVAQQKDLFAGLKDLMSWFFGDSTPPAQTTPTPAPDAPAVLAERTPTAMPVTTPTPLPANGAPGFSMKWDAATFDAKVGDKVDVTMVKNSAKIDGSGTSPLPADAVGSDYNWKDMMAMAFGGSNGGNSLNIQMEMRKFNAVFDKPNQSSGTSVVA